MPRTLTARSSPQAASCAVPGRSGAPRINDVSPQNSKSSLGKPRGSFVLPLLLFPEFAFCLTFFWPPLTDQPNPSQT